MSRGKVQFMYRYAALFAAVLVAGCGGEPQTVDDLEREIRNELGAGSVECGKLIDEQTACVALRRDGEPVTILARRDGDGFDWKEQ